MLSMQQFHDTSNLKDYYKALFKFEKLDLISICGLFSPALG
jgi:hypothetical protein